MAASHSAVRLIGGATAAGLALLGLIHIYWAAGGRLGRSVAVPERQGRPLFRPTPISTLGVAGGLFAAAALVLARLGIVGTLVPDRWTFRATWLLTTLFALRAVGDLRYVGLFKRVRGTPFARWDTRLFTPLCLLLALGSGTVAAARPDIDEA
jgi:hypothetical protein